MPLMNSPLTYNGISPLSYDANTVFDISHCEYPTKFINFSETFKKYLKQ